MVVYLKDGSKEPIYNINNPNEYAKIIKEYLGDEFLEAMECSGVIKSSITKNGTR